MSEMNVKIAPTLARFLRSDARRRVVRGPFGSGKSVTTGPMEIVRRAARQQRGPDGMRRSRWAVTRNTVPQLKDTTMKTWFDWFPNGSIGYYKETGKTFFIQQGDIRAEVIFRGLDDAQDVKNLLSLELTGAYMNECREMKQEIVEALDGRIDRYPMLKDGGATWAGIWGDTNSPEEFSYWYYIFEGLTPEGLIPEDDGSGEGNGWMPFVQPPALFRDMTLNPAAENLENLKPGYYERLSKGKTQEYIRVYLWNEYGHAGSGKPVHPMFNPDIHVAKQHLLPSIKRLLVVCADFGLTPAMALKQQDSFGRVLTLDEIVTQNMGLKRAITLKLKPLLKNKYSGYNILITGDPAGGERSQNDERTCVDIFRECGFKRVKFAESNNPIARIGATDSFLSTLTEQGPAYLVDPRCHFLIRGMSGGYRWKENKAGEPAEVVKKDIFSHICEAGQYGDMYFEHVDLTSEQDSYAKKLVQEQQQRGRGSYTRRS